MFQLPIELQQHIFEYDITYIQYFNSVLTELKNTVPKYPIISPWSDEGIQEMIMSLW